jgi:hypothetical protein
LEKIKAWGDRGERGGAHPSKKEDEDEAETVNRGVQWMEMLCIVRYWELSEGIGGTQQTRALTTSLLHREEDWSLNCHSEA